MLEPLISQSSQLSRLRKIFISVGAVFYLILAISTIVASIPPKTPVTLECGHGTVNEGECICFRCWTKFGTVNICNYSQIPKAQAAMIQFWLAPISAGFFFIGQWAAGIIGMLIIPASCLFLYTFNLDKRWIIPIFVLLHVISSGLVTVLPDRNSIEFC